MVVWTEQCPASISLFRGLARTPWRRNASPGFWRRRAIACSFRIGILLPGHSFPDKITGALRDCSHVIAIEPAAYNARAFTQAEFFNAWTRDPLGGERHMIPIKVGDCERHPLPRHFVEIDLVGRTAPEQRRSKTRRRGSGAHLAQRIGRL